MSYFLEGRETSLLRALFRDSGSIDGCIEDGEGGSESIFRDFVKINLLSADYQQTHSKNKKIKL